MSIRRSLLTLAKSTPKWVERKERARHIKGGHTNVRHAKRDGRIQGSTGAIEPSRGVNVREGTGQKWKYEMPLASPGGRTITSEVKRLCQSELFRYILLTPCEEATILPVCVLSTSFPKLAYAYKRAQVAMKSKTFSFLLFRFPSEPDTLYYVWSTAPEGAYQLLVKNCAAGLELNSLNVVHGSYPTKGVVVDLSELNEESPQYTLINRFRCPSPGPKNSVLTTFMDNYNLSHEGDNSETHTPAACYSGETFGWGGDSPNYVRPIKGTEEEEDLPQVKSLGSHVSPFHPMWSYRSDDADESEYPDPHDAVLGRANMLYYKNPEKALEAHQVEIRRGREKMGAFRKQVKLGTTDASSFDSL
eukprot:TRINITY_DN2557_c3_g1_i1.p1 TRINITY_DN2557_c3_g1~~TRINITY_DN2557_c3_g1_i1.p1  ORF type:complete len:368 (+),score=48.66 TRINITY_DN2557_c3_g1_i1:25-1104(+)